MIKAIVSYELLNLYREKLAVTLVAVSALLTMLGLGVGQSVLNEHVSSQHAVMSEQTLAVEEAKNALARRGSSDLTLNWWDDVADVRGYAFYLMVDYALKPPTFTAPIAVGQSDIYPNFFRIQVDTRQAVFQGKDTQHPLQRYLGKFDLAFFLVFILPLLLIGINFTAVAQEREREQIKIMIIQGLNPGKFLALQLAIRSSLILLPIFLIVAVWLGWVGFIFDASFSDVVLSISGSLLLVLAYSVFWVALTGRVISRGKVSAYNAAVLTASWLLLVIAIPMATNTLLRVLAPSPSRIAYIDVLRDTTDRVERDSEKTLADFFQDHPELSNGKSGSESYAIARLAKIAAIEKAMETMDHEYSTHLLAQHRIAGRFQWLSPATALYRALVKLAGNGLERHLVFVQEAQLHHARLRSYFQEIIVAADERGDFADCEGCKTPPTFTFFDDQPRFSFPAKDISYGWALFFLSSVFIALGLAWLSQEARKLNRLLSGYVR